MGKRFKKTKGRKARRLADWAFREVTQNVPEAVRKTKRKKGVKAARKQSVAIALSKARAKGARIPGAPKGRK